MVHQTTATRDPLLEQLRDVGVYSLNIAHPSIDQDAVAQAWVLNGICTISGWGLTRDYEEDLFDEPGVEVDAASIKPAFRDGNKIDWDAMRNAIADNHFAGNEDYENPNYPAGQARGSIRRFVDEYQSDTRILANLPAGTAVGRITGAPVYDPTNPIAASYDSHHVFTRNVEWTRDAHGDILTVDDSELLPDSFKHGRPTTTSVDASVLEDFIAVGRFTDGLTSE